MDANLDLWTALPERCPWDAGVAKPWGDATHRARRLRALAHNLGASRERIIAQAADETALFPDELAGEFERMVRTLDSFAELIEGAPVPGETIDPPGAHAIGPSHHLHRVLLPVGPVAVFGASNFPLAYGVCGGDSASALAAGCPVVIKEHPAHPRTGRLIASMAQGSGVPLAYVAHEDHADLGVPARVVRTPWIAGVGFTGSVRAGLAVDSLARARESPIPAYCEMGSLNVVEVSARAAAQRGEAWARALGDSILARHGQQCTKPGYVCLPDDDAGARMVEVLRACFESAPARDLLAPWIADAYARRVEEGSREGRVSARGAAGASPRSARATLIERTGAVGSLGEEIFGPACVVFRRAPRAMGELDLPAGGALTHTLLVDDSDEPDAVREWMRRAAARAGRVVVNGVPTGVRVSPAMVHAGPFPSTNHPEATAVGPLALGRWRRGVCFQGTPIDAVRAIARGE